MLEDIIESQDKTQEQIQIGDYLAPSIEQRTKKLMQGFNKSLYDVPQRKGWTRHFFNDIATRIQDRIDLGWRHVEIKDPEEKRYYNFHLKGNKVNIRAGTKKDGSDLIQYLLEIPEQIFNENKQIKNELRKNSYKGFSKRAVDESGIPEEERLNLSGFKAVGKNFEHLK